ncbi:SDR family oxidoreductase [Actinoplanes sp. NPDC051861]|uniref:SDR family oxidoreductase n=1 Tax=Actinoplanes sp. NPDC051861 TaxID=3155170 RepID=UPI003444F91A
MNVVVVGGTGRTGGLLVQALIKRGHDTITASRSTGVNAFTGEGLEAALTGADVIVDVTNPPEGQDSAEFFRVTSENLTAAGSKAGIRNHIVLSIIGLERATDLAYYRAKLAQEAAVRASGAGHTIVRAAQFFEYIPVILRFNTDGDEIRLAPVEFQPIALTDLIDILVEVVEAEPLNATIEVAGPEVLAVDEAGRRLAAPGQRVTTGGKPFFGADIPVDALVAGPSARLGRTTFDEWRLSFSL